jgi:hypothetical protein
MTPARGRSIFGRQKWQPRARTRFLVAENGSRARERDFWSPEMVAASAGETFGGQK